MKPDANPLPNIPIPVSAVWREFRIQVMPFLVFVAVIFGAICLWKTMPIAADIRGIGKASAP